MIGLLLPLLLATPKTQFSFACKQRSRKWNQNAVSQIVKFYTSYYDPDSVANENQPLGNYLQYVLIFIVLKQVTEDPSKDTVISYSVSADLRMYHLK